MVAVFVSTPDSYGIGKLVAVSGEECRVSFLHSITEREDRIYPKAQLRRPYLCPQTRVYVRDNVAGRWKMGRVVDCHVGSQPHVYRVRFPNGCEADVSEEDLEVRCFASKTDPTDVLACLGMETQYFHDRRVGALSALVGLRAASRGLTGLLSASIQLVPYQVDVARRVLSDPIQRYLLADEVGMGKTIEAGVIIRQCLLDDPASQVIVLCPASLVRQWQIELKEKFAVEEFGTFPDSDVSDRVAVLPFEDLPEVVESPCDLLVVDEAHHLVSGAIQDGRFQSSPIYDELMQFAHRVPRLLLLSATPVLGNEAPTLALLHLLDPSAQRLEDLEHFRGKVKRRQEIGQLLLRLTPAAPPFKQRELAAILPQEFPTDQTVLELARRLTEVAGSDRATVREAILSLKRHIAETYRLHQRLLRARRKGSEGQGWRWRSRTGIGVVDVDQDDRTAAIQVVLERWRLASLQVAAGDKKLEIAFAKRYCGLFQALGRSVEEFEARLERQLDRVAAKQTLGFAGEMEIIREFRHVLEMENEGRSRVDLAQQAIKLFLSGIRDRARVVAFSSSTEFTRALHNRLISIGHLLDFDVFCVDAELTPERVEREVQGFRLSSRRAVLICDRSGEEGLNLQFAHGLLHLDLPLSPNRIEQRIGRLDRFGREIEELRQRVVLPSDDPESPWLAWFELLRDGFRVFDRSISEVQFRLTKLDRKARLALYREGMVGLRHMINEVGQELAKERERLDQQYALDQLALGDQGAGLFFEELSRADGEDEQLQSGMDGWLREMLQLQCSRNESIPDSFRLEWTNRTLVPAVPWKPLFEPGLQRKLTYSRQVAVEHPGVALVRPGLPLVQNLQQYMEWDDRGSAFATWRLEPNWKGGTWLGFRLCYVVEADVARAVGRLLPEEEQRNILPNLRRRADDYLPPALETLHIDSDLNEVVEPLLLTILNRAYEDEMDGNGRRDYNLGSRREALFSVIDETPFKRLCETARQVSEEKLRSSAGFREKLATASRRAAEELGLRNDRLRRRQKALRDEGGISDDAIEEEIRLNEAVVQAVKTPRVRLDSIGFFVVAGYFPKEGARGN
jgi:ATP-dependent helicase HepA